MAWFMFKNSLFSKNFKELNDISKTFKRDQPHFFKGYTK